MNERGKPFPQIPRFPGEARLEGVPHAAKESLLLNNRNLVDTLEIITNMRRMNSDARSAYIKRLSESLNGNGSRTVLIDTSLALAKGELTDSERLKNDSRTLLERLEPGISRKIRAPFKDETLAALDESETISSHLDYFAEYLHNDPEDKSAVVAKHAREFFQDPKKILEYSEVNECVEESFDDERPQSEEETEYYAYCEDLDDALGMLSERPGSARPDEGTLLDWMKVYSYTEHNEVSEKVLSNWLNVSDLETAVDRIHKLATASFTSDLKSIRTDIVSIIGFRTEIMPIDSLAAIRYEAAAVRLFPEAWRKRREIDDALKVSSPVDALRNKPQERRQLKTRAYWEYMRELGDKKLMKMDLGERIEVIDDTLHDIGRGSWKRLFPRRHMEELDDDLVMQDGKLRQWITERQNRMLRTSHLGRNRKMLAEIQLPGLSRLLNAPLPEITSTVANALSELPSQELGAAANWRTLSLLVPPDLNQKNLDELNEANKQLRNDIKERRLRGVSQRGDRIFVTSAALQELGFTMIETHSQDDGYKIKVDVLGKTFVGKLDEDLQFLDERFNSQAYLPITGAFLNHVIVCHMHELLCSEFEDEDIEDSTNEHGRQFYSRRDHQRVLPFGDRPTPGQIMKALADYKVDLNERNKARIQAGETKHVTWVSAVERIDLSGTGPVESHAVNATERLEKILG